MPIGWTALLLGGACALALLFDIALRGYHQRRAAMDVVWPLTALYLGPVAAWLYLRHARPATARWVNGHPERPAQPSGPRGVWAAVKPVGACGAGCLLGSVASGVFVHRLAPAPLTPLEPGQAVSLVVLDGADLALACVLGLAFERLSAEQGPRRSPARMLASVAVFQVGVLGCIIVNRLVLRHSPQPPPAPAQWLAIQIGLAVGYAVCWGRGWVATPIDARPERRDDPAMAPCLTMGTDARATLRAV